MPRGTFGRLLREVRRVRLIGVTGVGAVAGLISSILIGRVFGPDGRGEYAVAIATMMVVGQVASLGLGEGLAIHAAQGRRLRRPRAVVGLTWLGYAVAALVLALLLDEHVPIVLGAATCAVMLQVTSYALTVGRTGLWSCGQLVQPLAVLLTATVALASPSLGVDWVTLSYALSPVVLVPLGLWVLGAERSGVQVARVSAVLWSGTQRALSVNVVALVRRVDVLVLGIAVPIGQVGQYAVAASLVDLCLIAPMVLAGLVLRDELRGAQSSLRRIVVVTVGWMVPPTLAVAGVGFWVIPAVWGTQFTSVHTTFLVLIPAAVAMGVTRNLQSWRAARLQQGLVVARTLTWAPPAAGLIATGALLGGPLGAAAVVSLSYAGLAVLLGIGPRRPGTGTTTAG